MSFDRLVLRVLPALWLILAMASPCNALDTNRKIGQFQHTRWTVRDGAPPDIWALAQGPRGFLWLGTGAGLYRFDGITFERIHAPPGERFLSADITALDVLPSGTIWIGYWGGGITRLKNGHLTNFTEEAGVPFAPVVRIVQTRDGIMWAATYAGLLRFNGSQWTEVDERSDTWPDRYSWISLARDGTLWAVADDAVEFLKPGAKEFRRVDSARGYAVIAQATNGTLWLSDSDGTRAIVPGADFKARHIKRSLVARRLLFDHDGAMWGTDADVGGIFHIGSPLTKSDGVVSEQPGIIDRFGARDGLNSDKAGPLIEDREGNILVGTNHGLDSFRNGAVVPEQTIPNTSKSGYALASDVNGNIYVALSEGVYRITPGQAPRLVSREAASYGAIAVGHEGDLWLAGDNELIHLHDGRRTLVSLPRGKRLGTAQSLVAARDNRVFVSLRNGLYVYRSGLWRRPAGASLLPQDTPTILAMGSDGTLWLGYARDRLVALAADGRSRVFKAKDGLAVGNITAIVPEGANLWIGGEFGLARLDGTHIQTIRSERVDVLSGITGIVADNTSNLWINGMLGVIRISRSELARSFANSRYWPKFAYFTYRDGLPGPAQQAGGNSTALAGPDGRIWFVTNRGIAWIDPAQIHHNRVPPLISILSLTAGGRSYGTGNSQTLPVSTSELSIKYTAPSFVAPERVRFRYRLIGWKPTWIDAGGRREVFYTNLGPGDYRFEVMASNNDGVWSSAPASVSFFIAPAFYQTRWAWLLAAIAAAAFLWFAYSLRVRYFAMQIEARLSERQAERMRIARELHDTMLQGFHGLMARFQVVANAIPSTDPAHGMMEEVLDRADAVLVESRDRVRDLRSAEENVSPIGEALRRVAFEVERDGPVPIEVKLTGTPIPLNIDVQQELLAIATEALRNAEQHSDASAITCELNFTRTHIWLVCEDDGIGIDPRVLREGRVGHWGLLGMSERARQIGAKLALRSSAKGTRVVARVKACIAYPPRNQGWLRRLRITR